MAWRYIYTLNKVSRTAREGKRGPARKVLFQLMNMAEACHCSASRCCRALETRPVEQYWKCQHCCVNRVAVNMTSKHS